MMRHIFRPSGKFFVSFVSALCVALLGATAAMAGGGSPAMIQGCDPAVWAAMTAKAEAQVAYDRAITAELINKPDSVLTMTCFSEAAGDSAKNGGAIFSGDFTTQLKTVMTVTGTGAYNCTQIGTLENQILTSGIDTKAPYATFNDLITNAPPAGGGTDFDNSWTASQTSASVFSKLKTAMTNLKQPTSYNFTADNSSCQVLVTAGIVTGPCP